MEIYCLLALIIIRYILGENRGNVLGSQLPIRRDDRLPFAIHQLSFSIYEKTISHEVVGPGRITVKVLGTEPENCYSRRHSRLGGSGDPKKEYTDESNSHEAATHLAS